MKKTFTYEITTTVPVFPRHLADMLTDKWLQNHLVSIKDCQRDDHVYGSTYKVVEEQEYEPMIYRRMVEYYRLLSLQGVPSTPERDALYWVANLLARKEWDGNMGMLTSYLSEFIETLQQFQAHCEGIGRFAEEE